VDVVHEKGYLVGDSLFQSLFEFLHIILSINLVILC